MTPAVVALIVAAWLIGSIPTAFLVGRANGVDLRKVGSGNLGATNVFRTLGWKWGVLVYAIDVAKGAGPVVWFPALAGVPGGWPWGMAFGIAAIIGHVRPVFLLGRGGGKGVATASGVFFALAPLAGLVSLIAFLIVVAAFRYVSLASLVGAVVLPLVLILQERALTPMVMVSVAIAMFVFWTHRDNIQRLRRGQEHRISSGGTRP
jgi:acyl phosphate:glycerol-3-phosphate acyltransferase